MPSTKDECNRFLDNGNLYHLSFTFYDNYCITCSHLIGLDQSTSSCLVWTSTFSTILYKCLSMAIFEKDVKLHSRRCRLVLQCTKIPPELKVPSSRFGGCSVCLNFPLICIDAPLSNSHEMDHCQVAMMKGALSAFITFFFPQVTGLLTLHQVSFTFTLFLCRMLYYIFLASDHHDTVQKGISFSCAFPSCCSNKCAG